VSRKVNRHLLGTRPVAVKNWRPKILAGPPAPGDAPNDWLAVPAGLLESASEDAVRLDNATTIHKLLHGWDDTHHTMDTPRAVLSTKDVTSGSRLLTLVGMVVVRGQTLVTAVAGFAGGRRPHIPGGRTPIPAAFKLAPTISRRTIVAATELTAIRC
jgi:hypothetical protein